MSGNNFFKRQASSLDSRNSYRKGNRKVRFKRYDNIIQDMLSDNFDLTCEECNTENMWEEDSEKSELNSVPASIKKSNTEVRMQEIEEILLARATFRNINGNICMWNGKYYKQLNLSTFASEVRKLLPKDIQKRISRYGRIKEAYEYLQANTDIAHSFKESDIAISKSMIAFDNGIYVAQRGELIESTCRYPILFKINARYLDDANIDTPYMDSLINSATGNDKEVLQLFYESLGYIFSQGIDAKKFFLLATAPDSGKSIIGEFLGKILGEDNISTIALNDLGNRFALGTINQKALNYNMDLPASELDNTVVQKLKQLTGDARIDCEEKYVQSKTSIHHCKFLFASNHPIKLKQADDAFFKRLVLIPFIYSVKEEERDYTLLDKLWEERHAITTKAARACHQLYEKNLVFTKPTLAEDMLSEWNYNTTCGNEMQEFFTQYYYIDQDIEEFIPSDIIFKQYKIYLTQKGRTISDNEKAQFSKKFQHTFGLKTAKRRYVGYTSPVNGYLNLHMKVEETESCDERG